MFLALSAFLHAFHDSFLGLGGGSALSTPSLVGGGTSSKRFPFHLFLLIFFFLLASFSCFYTLRPFQVVLLTLSCGAGKREIRRFVGGRV